MDKAKSLEVLRGMKFMQRKEETRRRELFELNQHEEFAERLRLATSGSSLQSASPKPTSATILYDLSFPRESYSLVRRSFLRKEEKSPQRAETKDIHMKDDNTEEDDGEVDTCSSEMDDFVDDPTAVSSAPRGKRFCVNTRAPALPKDLEKKVRNERREKRRREEEEEWDE